MKTNRILGWLMAGILAASAVSSSWAHVGYTNRNFGTLVPDGPPVTIANQTVTGNFGWADGTDDDFADSHKLRAYRFSLAAPAVVTLTFSASTNGGTLNGGLKPGFSVFRGLARQAPFVSGGSPDYDTAPITLAYLATLPGPAKRGAFRSLTTWRMGGEGQTGPVFDFEDPASGLSTFEFRGYGVDGNASLFGPAPGVVGDNSADGTATKSLFLEAGDYSVFVGGANHAGQGPPEDATVYGVTATISASVFHYVAGDPQDGGIRYQHQVTLGRNSTGSFSGHVGAWSWEDNSLFGGADQGTEPVGWTHTSNWVALKLERPAAVTVTMARDANVPWPSGTEPDRKADTSSMFPSLTIWRGWDNDGADDDTYNNRGQVPWAEDLQYLDHVDNSTAESITRTWYLPAGDYSMALGSKAPATNDNRQGYRITFTTAPQKSGDPVHVPGGVSYKNTVTLAAGDSGSFSNHVGAWSWEDNTLFQPGQPPVGWTHTSHWVAVNVEDEAALVTMRVERDASVPWPGDTEPERKADISSMFPSMTLYRGWDNDGGDSPNYNNRGNIVWAEDLRYLDHVDNSTETSITRTWRLPRGQYSLVVGSNAPATNLNRQGFKLSYSAVAAASVITGDPVPGGVGYTYVVTAGLGSSGSVANHVGAWSWEDNTLFAPGQPPVGWTHTSNWLGLQVTEPLTFTVTMSRNANVPWPSQAEPDRKADTTSMFPSFTVWRGWHNNGADSHMYNNRGPVAWAPGLTYMDHFDNSTADSITRSWTLEPGQYTFALGSNAPATNPNRQGYTFAWTTSAPIWERVPVILEQLQPVTVVEGRRTQFRLRHKPEMLRSRVQWMKDGKPIPGATGTQLVFAAARPEDAGQYQYELRSATGWAVSEPVALTVIRAPMLSGPVAFTPGLIGQPYLLTLPAMEGASYEIRGLPRGLRFDRSTRVIAGVPLVSGVFPVSVVLVNAAGRSAPETSSLTIAAMPLGSVATFTGALGRAGSLNEMLGGCVTVTTSSLGGFSSQLKLGTATFRATGRLVDAAGDASRFTGSVAISRGRLPALSLSFTYFAAHQTVQGVVSDGTVTLPFTARPPVADSAAFAGDYTFAADPGATVPASAPQGFSVGALRVDATGLLTGAARLADDTAVTFGGRLEAGGHFTLFTLLYRGQGSMLGVLAMQSAQEGDLRLTELSWFKRETGKATPRLYERGFGPVNLEVFGRKYDASKTPLELLGLTANPLGNTALRFAGGGAPEPATRLDVAAVEIPAGPVAQARMVSSNPANVSLTVLRPIGGGGGGGKATFKDFTFFKYSSRTTQGATFGEFTLEDVEAGTGGLPGPTRRRLGQMRGTIVHDGNGPRLVGYFLLPELPAVGAPASAEKKTPILSGRWMSE